MRGKIMVNFDKPKSSGRSYWIIIILAGLVLPWLSNQAAAKVPLDYQLMYEELQAAGAIKFYNKTEELLRLAEFDYALLRYRFLKGQLLGQSDYSSLMPDINRRLKFLQGQMRLTEAQISPMARKKVLMAKDLLPKKKKVAEESEPKGTVETSSEEGAPKPSIMTPGAPGKPAAPPAPATPAAPPTTEGQQPAIPPAPGQPGGPESTGTLPPGTPPGQPPAIVVVPTPGGGAKGQPPAATVPTTPPPGAPAPVQKKSFLDKLKNLVGIK
jgi:hypothetical protein